jgi:hypothetical protein
MGDRVPGGALEVGVLDAEHEAAAPGKGKKLVTESHIENPLSLTKNKKRHLGQLTKVIYHMLDTT